VRRSTLHVIPVRKDVQFPHGNRAVLEHLYRLLEALGQWEATGANPYQYDVLRTVVAFQYLMGNARQGTADVSGTEKCLRTHPCASHPVRDVRQHPCEEPL
jgi:hypothetical protein